MLKKWEKSLLEYYLKNKNAKWIRVYHNKHPVLATRVIFYTKFKRRLKDQPYSGELTYTGMFKNLVEGDWYLITNLLNNYEEVQN